ncbi:dp [Cordylochernes scorpioides]|uniref:Dp n=1 Tax=Cordylochernes scorpioides TaxID=51811 RepID=A0ABY6KRC9_9ARAC|nr:dp [Cordylochernes scorpioides]
MAAVCVENAECCNLPGHYNCKCKPGFTGNATVSCVDVNECEVDPDCCGKGAICNNVPGSFTCYCPSGYDGDPYRECYDMDECRHQPCGEGAQCTNTRGGYTCSCPRGFVGNPTPKAGCVDVNECLDPKFPCGKHAECVNVAGSFYCQCPPGYSGNPKIACVGVMSSTDINECPHACGANTECVNNPGSYTCTCKPGYTGDPYLSAGCRDEDECLLSTACGVNAICHNLPGSYDCACKEGYSGNPLTLCADIDECRDNPCAENAFCRNLPGSFSCECAEGYDGNAREGCARVRVDVPCHGDFDCTANAQCIQERCHCRPGYQVHGIECADVDECRTPHICGRNANCKNLVGSYTCECKSGFEKIKQSPDSPCRDVNECLFGRFPCGKNAKCVNTDGSFECTCPDNLLGDPHIACKSPCEGVNCGPHATCQVNGKEAACICDLGFTFDPLNVAAGCVDINECDISHGPSGLCGQGAICTNVPGSYHCYCPPGFTGDPFRYCEDINECDRRFGPTGQCGESAVCVNSLGSFTCTCPKGYSGNGRVKCYDINECSQAYGPNGKCGISAICTNTPGDFECRCPPGTTGNAFERYPCDDIFCGDHAKCQLDENKQPVCVCSEGYTGRSNSLPGCVDLDECSGLGKHVCGENALCRNIPGSYECVCPHGYAGDPYRGCIGEEPQISECSDTKPCPINEECVTHGRSPQCFCMRGYTRDPVSNRCRDINECTEYRDKPACGLSAFCMNMDGSFVCHCPPGHTGNAYSVCYPEVITCQQDNQCPGNTICLDDGIQGFHCGCRPPFVREGEYCILVSRNCSKTSPCPENQECIFTGPTYGFCICPQGYTVEANGYCRDIDECSEIKEFSACGAHAECINQPGSYECICPAGYSGDPKKGCSLIEIGCKANGKDCPKNQQCVQGQCRCLPPYVLEGQDCKHPCDWYQCGQYANCVMTPRDHSPRCECLPGCTGDPYSGCWDVNECTADLPVDPNGPCAVGAICINLVGGYHCECPPRMSGDPYKTGCRGSAGCSSDRQCPKNAICDTRGGACVDPCATSWCGPNSECYAENHKAVCKCKPGFTGNAADLEKGCASPCAGVWCSVNAKCIVNSQNQGICHCLKGFSGNPWAGGGCYPDHGCSASQPCGPSQDCVDGACVERCEKVQCGQGARCNKANGQCQCLPRFIGNPNVLCVPPMLESGYVVMLESEMYIYVRVGDVQLSFEFGNITCVYFTAPQAPICSPVCGVNSHCVYGAPNKCECNPGFSGNPYRLCSSVQRCDTNTCGTNANCVEGRQRLDCVCPVGYQGNPFLGCSDVNECLQSTGTSPCGSGATCINTVGSYHCVCPAGTTGNPLFSCTTPRVCQPGQGCPCGPTTPCPAGERCRNGICLDACEGVRCGPNAHCLGGSCACIEGTEGQPSNLNTGCRVPTTTSSPHACLDDNGCPVHTKCRPDHVGINQCYDVCIDVQCGRNAICSGHGHTHACQCPPATTGDPNDLIRGCQPLRRDICQVSADCHDNQVCKPRQDGIRDCIDVCLDPRCGLNANCVGRGHRPVCECPLGFSGNPHDATHGCQPPARDLCSTNADCAGDEACTAVSLPSGIKDCIRVCIDQRCGPNAHCVGKLHRPICECRPGFLGNPNDPLRGCQPPSPNECENNKGCPDYAVCRVGDNNIKKCYDVCKGTNCGPNAQCVGKGQRAVCECLPGYEGNPTDFLYGCIAPPQDVCHTDSSCPEDHVCLLTTNGIKDCVDVCQTYHCGPNAQCLGRNHHAECRCPSGYSGDPLSMDRGCQLDQCIKDADCPDSSQCKINREGFRECFDACEGRRCGPNAACVGTRHRGHCECKPGFEGNGEDLHQGCRPRDLCRTEGDCAENQVCRPNQKGVRDCVDGCMEILCGRNAQCSTSNHIANCACLPGHVGDPYNKRTGCEPQSKDVCFGDHQCSSNAVCKLGPNNIRDCYEGCEHVVCGPRAKCVTTNHRPKCVCTEGFVGNPEDPVRGCHQPHQCNGDGDCFTDEVCRPGTTGIRKCVYTEARFECNGFLCVPSVVCIYADCSPTAECVGQNHQAVCRCPPGYTGDPRDIHTGCVPISPHRCEDDSACPDSHVCRPGPNGIQDCVEVCNFAQCGPNAICKTSNHRSKCECLPNHLGDPNNLLNGCKPPARDECHVDTDCFRSGDICKPDNFGVRKCVDACRFVNCVPHAECIARDHHAKCECIRGYIRDPNNPLDCIPKELDECKDDVQCPTVQTCKPNVVGTLKCAEVCLDFSCSPNSACVAVGHRGRCSCQEGYTGDPNTRDGCIPLIRHECDANHDCPQPNEECHTDLQGIRKCLDACQFAQCGPNAVCVAVNHAPQCQCPSGKYVGNAYDLTRGCQHVECLSDSDCSDNMACTKDHYCYDPCVGGCGVNAVCLVQRHQVVCHCRAGYTGDPSGRGCHEIRVCELNPCHPSAKCIDTPGSYVCQCQGDYIGDPYKDGCRHPNSCPNGNSDCPPDSACLPDVGGERQCKNPCDHLACGYNAFCKVINHRAGCTCPQGFRANPDPESGCLRVSVTCSSPSDCGEQQACIGGQCRWFCTMDTDCAVGEKCSSGRCVLPCFQHSGCPPREACVTEGYCQLGCRHNNDCHSTETCVQNQCKNPCEIKGVCGPNAICLVSNHEARCECNPGFEGSPTPILGCKRKVTICSPSITCPTGLTCVGERCRAPCSNCVEGEMCVNGVCMVMCSTDTNCPVGEICLQQYCRVGCRTDSDCHLNEECQMNRCTCKAGFSPSSRGCEDTNECLSSPCHPTALCVNTHGSYTCRCKEGDIGDGYSGCRSAGECPRGNSDCPPNSACGTDEAGIPKCINPCLEQPCGPRALCLVANHMPQCHCPQTGHYIGDPHDKIKGCVPVECLYDGDCPLDRQCLNYICESPCANVDCGPHGSCVVRDRQALCRCKPGYENNGRLVCVDINECNLNPCHPTAKCENTPGSFSCHCPHGLIGNPMANPGCHDPNICYNGNIDCADSAQCLRIDGVPYCKDPCESPKACGQGAQCRTINHEVVCACSPGFTGDPHYRCEKVECVTNEECRDAETCIKNKCVSACAPPTGCGDNTVCIPESHRAVCRCKDGYYGDPIAGCRKIILCTTDVNCPIGELCQNGVCGVPCNSDRDCGTKERCEAGRCIAICLMDQECPQGQACHLGKCETLDRCDTDTECADNEVCRASAKGYNDCSETCENALCAPNAICVSKGHMAICKCREGYTGDPINRGCEPVECLKDQECKFEEICHNYTCISPDHSGGPALLSGLRSRSYRGTSPVIRDPCILQKLCGENSYCVAQAHSAICRCHEGYEGDPVTGCKLIDYCSNRPCHFTALCQNKFGGYDCICPPDKNIGSPYAAPGCRGPNECPNGNSDCPPTAVCERELGTPMCKNACLRPGICGLNANCHVENHLPICFCPPGFTGNPEDPLRGCVRVPVVCSTDLDCLGGLVCENRRCRPPCRSDQDCAKRELCQQGHCVQGCKGDQECLMGEICISNKCIVGCRKDIDCSTSEACFLNMCSNPCESASACGTNALCKVVSHRQECSCLPGFTGNPNIACQRILPVCHTAADCAPHHFCLDGKCRVECNQDKDCSAGEKCFNNHCLLLCRKDNDCQTNEICIRNRCSAGCRDNEQCPPHLACVGNQCRDPCEGSATCGPNAECRVLSHRPVCSCKSGFVGRPNANVGCGRPVVYCQASAECAPGSVCYNGRCLVSCSSVRNCAVNEKCVDSRCRSQCFRDRDCSSGEICEQNVCRGGCRADQDCANNEACVNNECIDQCASRTACGTNAVCQVVNHETHCSCPPDLSGDPYVQCDRVTIHCKVDDECGLGRYCEASVCRVTCSSDNECFDNEKCRDRRCSVICTNDNSCPNGYICEGAECLPGCRLDAECPLTESCINYQCINPCASPTVCGTNAQCQPINHRPLCTCLPQFTGDPRIECSSVECIIDSDCGNGKICQNYRCLVGCRSDQSCQTDQVCTNRQCQYLCQFSGTCGVGALCKAVNHRSVCTCPSGFMGNPLVECIREPLGKCLHDADCEKGSVCLEGRCETDVECRKDADCLLGHICQVNKCFVGCRVNENCPLDQGCYAAQCQDPCSIRGACGHNARCTPVMHQAVCTCLPGFTGNPRTECKQIGDVCKRNQDCAIGQVCDSGKCIVLIPKCCDSERRLHVRQRLQHGTDLREQRLCLSHSDCSFTLACLDKKCQTPCQPGVCGTNAECVANNHEAICRCPPDYTGDPKLWCKAVQMDCHADNDCDLGKICISNRCIFGCKTDAHCPIDKACLQGRCTNPCHARHACGVGALCRSLHHRAECSCPPNFLGDPKVRCSPHGGHQCVKDTDCPAGFLCDKHLCIVVMEGCRTDSACNPGEICENTKCIVGCRRDSDCTFDKACINSQCVNPCTTLDACGRNAHCRPVVHRPLCTCQLGYEGNPFDYCQPVPILPPVECVQDKDCSVGHVCEASRCFEGCRSDKNCPFDQACVNKQCQNPCSYPGACGINSQCTPVNHRHVCTCPSHLTGDPNVHCDNLPSKFCFSDVDCANGEICENSLCIDACRTDDSCPYDKKCIYKRCQDPCSFFQACGLNSNCNPINHEAICSCPPLYTGNPKVHCSLERIGPGGCSMDDECHVGTICEGGECIEGCRADSQCPQDEACVRRRCEKVCKAAGICGTNTDCKGVAHRPLCTCLPGFVGDPHQECKIVEPPECHTDTDCPIQHLCEHQHCIIGCRTDESCGYNEACVNRICQNPCGLFGSCGRNALCNVKSHKVECACPIGFRGNANVQCIKDVAKEECSHDKECSVGHICENTRCISGCRHDNNCPKHVACINRQCQNPCLLPNSCGTNAECQPVNHRPICTCPLNYRGDPMLQCIPVDSDYCEHDLECPVEKICENKKCIKGCRDDANCRFAEKCINHLCQNPCTVYGACGHNAICKPINHDRECICQPGYTGDPRVQCVKVLVFEECAEDKNCVPGHICQGTRCIEGCRTDVNCPYDQSCIRGHCVGSCEVSGICGREALCTPVNHKAHCSCPTAYTGDPAVECKLMPEPTCRHDTDCAVGEICVRSECVVGCRMHSNCPFDKACVNRVCQNPCAVGGVCGVNTQCHPANHQAVCSCLPSYTGDPLRQCMRVEHECDTNSDCGSGYVCINNECKDIDECLQGPGPCAVGAMCTNLPGGYKCSCPAGLTGDPYHTRCQQPVTGCRHDDECGDTEVCDKLTKECFDVCTKPGICGRNAHCRAQDHRYECFCPSGYTGNPYGECSVIQSCGLHRECPGNLQCLGTYCGCPPPFKQIGFFCIMTSHNCTTTNPCPDNQECVYEGVGSSAGFCVCPRGYVLMASGQCRDLNECEQSPFPCGPGARCYNTIGSYNCQCPPGTIGDPQYTGCTRPEGMCLSDIDCPSHLSCDLAKQQCYDPCMVQNPCVYNAECRVVNHEPQCHCRPGFTGDPTSYCYHIHGCKTDYNCPGNLLCLSTGYCGCPAEFRRISDYCIMTSMNCTTNNPCPNNQECVYTGPHNGFCICPRGYTNHPSGSCIDVDECKDAGGYPCGSNAECINLPGTYTCVCPPSYEGEPYSGNCIKVVREGCTADSDCAYNEACDVERGHCEDVCPKKRPCGSNAICRTENHVPICLCPPGYSGNPLSYCFKVVECGVDYTCPGNLICLSSITCGCPSDFMRIGDYCMATSRNCTTTNPCPVHEECIYTGPERGFCVCPRGYVLSSTGLCTDIDECHEPPCAPGAKCTNLPGSYRCYCPPDTIGDPVLEGCVGIKKSCTSNLDCAVDKECDVSSGECISPCHICGKNAICTVTNHTAICSCPPNMFGDPYDPTFGCYTDPVIPVRTPPPESGGMTVMCLADGVQVSVQIDGFNGVIYVKGHSQDPQCRRIVASTELETIDFKVLFNACGLIHVNGEASFILVIQKHPKLVTYRARAYHIKCVYNTGEKTVKIGLGVDMITTSGTIANTGPPPRCIMTIVTVDGREVSSVSIGDDLLLRVQVEPSYIYGGFARSCVAKTLGDDKILYEVTDANGCATEPDIFGNWELDPKNKFLIARFNAFKFPTSNNLRFQCNIRVCFGSCPPVNCKGVDAFGRRRRRQADVAVLGAEQEGSLREEITVQSNAILTLERKDSQVAPTTEGPIIEEIDSVCLPKLGLIVSLVITTLLALVAVAVAISCWLMAYRRSPKTAGPLPHPPDFPNPLYSTPEPLTVEPSPDYFRPPPHGL